MRNNKLFDNTELGVMDFPAEEVHKFKAGFEINHSLGNDLSIVFPLPDGSGNIETVRPKGLPLKVVKKMVKILPFIKNAGGIYTQKDSTDIFLWYTGGYKLKSFLESSPNPDKVSDPPETYLLRIKETGKVSGCVITDGEPHQYSIKTLSNPEGFSSEAYIAALFANVVINAKNMQEPEKNFFQEKFTNIFKDKILPLNEMVLADNLYKLLEDPEMVEKQYGIKVPFFVQPDQFFVQYEDFFKFPEIVDELVVGSKCPYFPIKGSPSANISSWRGKAGSFEIQSGRKLLPFEEDKVFKIPDYYEEPKDLMRYARLYHDTFGKKLNLRFFLLAGPSGTGKTEWANCFSAMIHRPIVHFNCDAEMTKDDLLTRFVPADGVAGTIKHVPTELLQALQFGWVIEIAEPTLLQPAVLAAMNSLFDSTGQTVTPDGRIIKIHPETVVIMTTNLRYEGCNSFNQSVLSRFTMVNLPYLEDRDLIERIKTYSGLQDESLIKRMIRVYQDAVEKANELEIHDGAIDPRALYQWAAASAIDGEVWQNGLDMFISKCSLDESNFDVFIHCLETEFSKGERVDP